MSYEKLECCPDCGRSDNNFIYDAQQCFCGYGCTEETIVLNRSGKYLGIGYLTDEKEWFMIENGLNSFECNSFDVNLILNLSNRCFPAKYYQTNF